MLRYVALGCAFQNAAHCPGRADVQIVDVPDAFTEGIAIQIGAIRVAAALVSRSRLIAAS